STSAERRGRAEAGDLTGVSKWDLDTPALCVDLDKLEQNISAMRRNLAPMKVASRPHAKTHKCPAIAKLQLAGGSIGICTAKVSEAEVFSASGIESILMTTANVTPNKIRRAMAIRKANHQFIQAVDYAQNALDLNDAAREAGISADVVIDVAVGTRSGGTGTYNILPKAAGVTDLQVGSYIFMDCQYLEIGGESNDQVYTDFAPSLTVLTTVLNTYFEKSITTDAGAKALTLNKPGPWVIGEKDFAYNAGSDEFGVIKYEKAERSYKVGDKLELIVPHCDPAVNEYDQLYAIRKDRVEAVWPI